MELIKEYFKHHPKEMDRYLNQNERFVFFKKDQEKEETIGAAGCKLTPEALIAIDKRIFPLGAPAYVEYPEFKTNNKGELVDIKKTACFVFCQDTGGAIKGPGRVDIYFGEGKKALAKAEHHTGRGKLYFLVKSN